MAGNNNKGQTMTRKEIKAQLDEAIAEGFAPGVESAFVRLMFFGASPSEFRGVSDAKLSDEELWVVYESVRPGSSVRDQIVCAMLDDEEG